MKTKIIVIVLAVSFALIALIFGGIVLNTTNEAKSLKVSYDSKLKANEATFDNMWKKVRGAAEVTDRQKDSLKEILIGYAQARTTGGDNALSKWVQESVPHVDTSTFNNLQNIIAGSRDSWTFNQLELVDIANQYNRMRQVQPSGWILATFGDFPAIDAKIITSTKTEETFKAGRDDDVAVFKKS